MPLILIVFLIWLFFPQRTRKAPKRITYQKPQPLPVYDPVKAQKEADRQADRARREAERQRKEAERIAKADEARRAAEDEITRLDSFLLQYRNLYDMIEAELNNPSLTEYKRIQLTDKLIKLEEKIYRTEQRRARAYFTANN